MIFGYAYPAYECFKTIEKNKPEIDHLLFWCQYWILVALLTVCERVGDSLLSWLPMYGEAKLALFIYLWYPGRNGTAYLYHSIFRPYLAKHETDIDNNLLELKFRLRGFAFSFWQTAASYGQISFLQFLQYASFQTAVGPNNSQLERPRARDGQPNLLKPNSSFAQWNSGPVREAALSAPLATSHPSIRPEGTQASKAMKVESASSSENVNVASPSQEAVRPTRGKLKRVLAIVNRH